MDYREMADVLCRNLAECSDCEKCFPQMAEYCKTVTTNSEDTWPTCEEMIYNYLRQQINE